MLTIQHPGFGGEKKDPSHGIFGSKGQPLVVKTEVAGQNMEDIELAGDPKLAEHEKTKKTQTNNKKSQVNPIFK